MPAEIYLDNQFVAKPSTATVKKMLPFYTEKWGSLSAPHQRGQSLYPDALEAYKQIYKALDANEQDNVILTSCGAEAVNQVFFSAYFENALQTGKNQFITSNIDEAASLMTVSRLEQMSCVGKMAYADETGRVTAKAIADKMNPRTCLVSLSWANGLTGVINPVAEIAALCQERGALLHLEASHVIGKIYLHPDEIGAQYVSFNGEQLHAPKGSGLLWVKQGAPCIPHIIGGLEQGGYRSGSLNVPSLVGIASALTEAVESRDLMCTEGARLRDKLESGIVQGFPEAVVFYQKSERVPTISAIGFPGISNEALLYSLSRKGVYASIGGGSFQQISLVLMGGGIPQSLANSAISFSLSKDTTEEEIDRAIEIIVDCAKQLSKVSYQNQKGSACH